MSKKAKIITGIIVGSIVATIVMYGLFMIMGSLTTNLMISKIDQEAVAFVFKHEELFAEYGDVSSMSDLDFEPFEQTETTARLPYKVRAEKETVLVYISFVKEKGNWVAVSLEIIGPYQESAGTTKSVSSS